MRERARAVNLAHCRRFGRRREEILGRTRDELLGRPASEEIAARTRGALEGVQQRFEYDEPTDGGSRRFDIQLIPDIALQAVAKRLAGLVRPTDAVARLGGDEFVILLCGVGRPAIPEAIAQKVVAAVGAPFDVDGERLEIGASVGVAFGVEPGGDWRDLVARADASLYRAKASGRGRHAK